MVTIKQIEWTESKREHVISWQGILNGKTFFTIDRFKTDNAIMTSHVVPMKMRTDEDVEELQEAAQILTEAYINSLLDEKD